MKVRSMGGRPGRARRVALGALGLGMSLAVACQPTPDKLPSGGVTVPPPDKSVFLRASFDDDPSPFIGRFLPDTLTTEETDENQAMQTRCSEFITFKEVKAAGSFDEYYSSARQASLSVGLPGVASGNVGAGSNATVRVRYELSKKMRAEVSDQEGFDRCCQAAPDQCPDFIIGEFFFGNGEVFQAMGSKAGLDGEQIGAGMSTGEVDVKDELVWKRQTRFEEVYFAFRKQRVRNAAGEQLAAGDDDCSWANNIPTSLDGQFFVGVSAPTASEAQARSQAMRDARAQTVRFLGEFITTASATTSNALEGYLQDEEVVTAAAEGLASRVKDRRWCPAQTIDTPKGPMFTIKVLAFFPEADKKEAARETLQSVEKSLEARGKLDGKAKEALGKALEGLK